MARRTISEQQKREFSKRLNYALNYRGFGPTAITCRKLAIMFEVSKCTVSRWMNGDLFPSVESGVLVADVLEISFEWLMVGRGTMIPLKLLNASEIAILTMFNNLNHQGKIKLTIAAFTDCSQFEITPRSTDENDELIKLVKKTKNST